MAGARVADILAALVAVGPAASWPRRLVEECRQAMDMSGVGLVLTGRGLLGEVLATTGGPAQRMEDLQFALGEGPCVDASRTGDPVFCSDLGSDGASRWPAFSSGALEAGVAAAFTFPLNVGANAIGVLDLYRDSSGPLSKGRVTEAVAFADASVAVLLHLQEHNGPPGRSLLDVPRGNGGARRESDALAGTWIDLVDRRAVVHQAAGMISVQLGADVAEALARLRAHAIAAERQISDVATDVVARRLRFDHSESGIDEGSGPNFHRGSGESP
jgi:hypothetical protein